jgi:hypothetical protein
VAPGTVAGVTGASFPGIYIAYLGATLALECPVVVMAYAGVTSRGRRLAAALATNLATHGLLWSLWPLLPGSYPARLAVTEASIVLVEAGCYRFLLGGTAMRALGVSALANALSVAAGFALSRVPLG